MHFASGIILFHMHYGYIFSAFFLTVVFASMTKMRFRHQQKPAKEEEEAIPKLPTDSHSFTRRREHTLYDIIAF